MAAQYYTDIDLILEYLKEKYSLWTIFQIRIMAIPLSKLFGP